MDPSLRLGWAIARLVSTLVSTGNGPRHQRLWSLVLCFVNNRGRARILIYKSHSERVPTITCHAGDWKAPLSFTMLIRADCSTSMEHSFASVIRSRDTSSYSIRDGGDSNISPPVPHSIILSPLHCLLSARAEQPPLSKPSPPSKVPRLC